MVFFSGKSSSNTEPKAITSKEIKAIQLLDAPDKSGNVAGTVGCRLHAGPMSHRIPHISKEGHNVESTIRSRLRLENLTALRGMEPGTRMIGPGNYYGNLECLHKHAYTIEMNEGIPIFYQQKFVAAESEETSQPQIPDQWVTQLDANWISGEDKAAIEAKKAEYGEQSQQLFGASLFSQAGILEINSSETQIPLKKFDATKYDLSAYGARLVRNDQPFRITDKKLPSKDEFRAVSYLYEPGYADYQVNEGGGLFLEFHDFSQIITPIDSNTEGFVTLAKWEGEPNQSPLNLIAVQIPYGYTLIIDAGCIHGDTNLSGMFMMAMTSNHRTMNTADTVFLKTSPELAKTEGKTNIELQLDSETLDSSYHDDTPEQPVTAPRPLAFYRNSSPAEMAAFNSAAKGIRVTVNPFSAGFWQRTLFTLEQESIPQLMGFLNAVIDFILFCASNLGAGITSVCTGAPMQDELFVAPAC